MKRIELFEFEDFQWLPHFIRKGITDLIQVLHRMLGTADTLAKLIIELREKHHFDQIVDLGSGSGGPMPDVILKINENSKAKPVQLTLTDLYPSEKVVRNMNQQKIPNVRYHAYPMNALNLESADKGLKTMIASFHHMRPDMARRILQSAEENGQPILIYEIAKNNVPLILWILLLPISLLILMIMTWVMTPFTRPFSLKRLLFTYLIPIIPVIYAWDGQASLKRTYTFSDLEKLIVTQSKSDYHWEMNEALNKKGKKAGYYLFGYLQSEPVE